MSIITIPKLIDCHVHFREPGFPHKANMETESASANAGGIYTVCEMPNTNPPTTTIKIFAEKVELSKRVQNCDLRFFFGITDRSHLDELISLWTNPEHAELKARCSGIKLFLENSTGDQKVEGGIVEEIFAACGEHDIPLVAHCEDADMNAAAEAARKTDGIEEHSITRPAESEAKSIAYAIGLARVHGTPFHVAHMTTSFGVDLVREAKKEGVSITCEACPHHLFLSTEDYPTLGTHIKMNPPVRTPEHRAALWEGIADGTIDCIGTDHAPHTLEEKAAANPLEAPSGVPGVETGLPLLLTVAAGNWPHPDPSARVEGASISYDDIVRMYFTNPNRIYRLGKSDEPVLKVDTEKQWTIHAADLHSQCDWTPYEGWSVTGAIVTE